MCRENGRRAGMNGGGGWEGGEPRQKTAGAPALVAGRVAARNTSEEFKAGGNSRLKTPLPSRELNSNVRSGGGKEGRKEGWLANAKGRGKTTVAAMRKRARFFTQIDRANGDFNGRQFVSVDR